MKDSIDIIMSTMGVDCRVENTASGSHQLLSIVIRKDVEVFDNHLFAGFEVQATVATTAKLLIGDTIEDINECQTYLITKVVSETPSKTVFTITEM